MATQSSTPAKQSRLLLSCVHNPVSSGFWSKQEVEVLSILWMYDCCLAPTAAKQNPCLRSTPRVAILSHYYALPLASQFVWAARGVVCTRPQDNLSKNLTSTWVYFFARYAEKVCSPMLYAVMSALIVILQRPYPIWPHFFASSTCKYTIPHKV